MATKTHPQPKWWSRDYDSAWDRVKAAFRRDWEQTKHDFGGKAPDLNQDVDDTVGQAAGTRPIPPGKAPNFDESEAAYRFGYGAHRYFHARHPEWNDELEDELRADWSGDWDKSRTAIRRGWEYQG